MPEIGQIGHMVLNLSGHMPMITRQEIQALILDDMQIEKQIMKLHLISKTMQATSFSIVSITAYR